MSAARFGLDALLRPWRLHRGAAPALGAVMGAYGAAAALWLSLCLLLPGVAVFGVVATHGRGLPPTPAGSALLFVGALGLDLVARWAVLALVGLFARKPAPARAAVAPAAGVALGLLPVLALWVWAAASGLIDESHESALRRLTYAVLAYVLVAGAQHVVQVARWLGRGRLLGGVVGLGVWFATLAVAWLMPSSGGNVGARVVDGLSMAPALAEGDRVLVEQGRAPALGDIVLVDLPDGGDVFRRVIGVGGDTVTFDGGGCVRGGESMASAEPEPAPDVCDGCLSRQERAGDHSYRIAASALTIFDRSEPVTVPEGSVYVVGDRRDRRSDALHRGPIPLDRVVGVAFYRYGSAARRADLSTR